MKKMFFTFLLISFASVLINGQDKEAFSIYDQESESLSAKDKIKRLQYNTTIGSSFFYSGAFGSGTEFFAAPHLSYGLTPKLSIHGGIMFSYTSFFGSQSEEAFGGSAMMQFPGMSVYGSASYQLNEKLSIYGTGIRHLSTVFPGEDNNFTIPGYYSYSLGSTYQLWKNVSIGASIHVRDRSSYYSPFSMPSEGGYYSPFDW